MDDLVANRLMHKLFSRLAAEGPKDDAGRREYAFKLSVVMRKFIDWYGSKITKTGEDKFSGAPVMQDLPATTGVEELKPYEAEMMPILADFNRRGVKAVDVMDHLDRFVDRIREGWAKRIEEINKRIGK